MGLSLAKGGSMEPFELPGTAPVLYFIYIHNNRLYKKLTIKN